MHFKKYFLSKQNKKIQLILLYIALLLPCLALADVTYIHVDNLGSTIAETNESGEVVRRYSYLPYGKPVDTVNDSDPGYTGHVYDDELGLSYMQARYYDPVLGRFMAMDSAAVNPNDPRTFNRYAYANNNPYKYIDPDGRDAIIPSYAWPQVTKEAPHAWNAIKGGTNYGLTGISFFAGGSLSLVPRVFARGVSVKSVKSTLSTLHTRGTKIPGGRKIGDTLAGSNKIKNGNGETFKRVDFAPSKPHNGLSPHTHSNFRNRLPDGSVRSGVSRDVKPVTRRDIIDATRQGRQRTHEGL